LPIGKTAVAPPITACATGHLHTTARWFHYGIRYQQCTGLCPGVVMAGTVATFNEGWRNSGNTDLDSIVITYNIDNILK